MRYSFSEIAKGKKVRRTLVHRMISTVASKVILLSIGAPENVVSNALSRNNNQSMGQAHIDREIGQEASLKRVVHGQPGQQSIGEHETESIGGDVHSRQDGRFVPERVDNVKGLKEENGDHRVGDASESVILLAGHTKVQKDPADETRTELDKVLDVECRVG